MQQVEAIAKALGLDRSEKGLGSNSEFFVRREV